MDVFHLVSEFFSTIFLFPIRNVMVAFYQLFLFLHIPGAFGFAIIALVVLVRLVLHPFFKQQLETSKKMQQLKPRLDKLSAQFKNDPKQLQVEQMKLYQEAGINPAAGCIFMLIQIPVFIALYNTLSLFLLKGTGTAVLASINKTLYLKMFPFLKLTAIDPHFFGLNLALSPQKSGMWFYYIIPVITAVLQYFQAKSSMPMTVTPPAAKELDEKGKKASSSQDFQSAMNTQMKYIFPIMIGYFSFTLPVGLSLYWNIFSLFSIMQYRMVHKKVGDEKLSEKVAEKEEKYLESKMASKPAIKQLKNRNKKKK